MNEKLNEIIEFINNMDFGGEYDCAIENHRDVLKEHRVVDYDVLEITDGCEDMTERRTFLDEFIHDYYKSVVKSVCNVIETYKEEGFCS